MLTGKQMKTYRFIRRCILLENNAPTYHRIGMETGRNHMEAYQMVSRICKRGWLARQGRRIVLKRDLPAPTTTAEFDYFAVDYENLNAAGWPRLVDAVSPGG